MAKFSKSIFFKPRNPRLARAISIKTPEQFKESIKKVKALKGITKRQKQAALNLAKARARAQLARKALSTKERKEFEEIVKIKSKL